jgi:radical SAM/Cys-rich protein
MTRETIDRILGWLDSVEISIIDLTGGAPEMIPDFRYLVERLKALQPKRHIIDRCNLTILLEKEFEWLGDFLKKHEIEIIASMPCYSPKNVDAQRGQGVFDQSITALQLLNELGYGREPHLPLHLVYNPIGATLPPKQEELEAEYKVELLKHFNITFNRLYTITNMPIARFASYLRHNGEYEKYQELLVKAFNPNAVDGLMCRNTISIGWRGEVYDCDFNQQLGMQWQQNQPLFLWDVDSKEFESRNIMTGNHCFGCTAGSGSSCTGTLVEESLLFRKAI